MSTKEEKKLRSFNLKHCILVKGIWEHKKNKKLHYVGRNLIATIWGLLKIMYSSICALQCFCFLPEV